MHEFFMRMYYGSSKQWGMRIKSYFAYERKPSRIHYVDPEHQIAFEGQSHVVVVDKSDGIATLIFLVARVLS
jgi:hypothetical protein